VYAHTGTGGEWTRERLLLLSGGVSAGKYESWTRVRGDLRGGVSFLIVLLVQPGQPGGIWPSEKGKSLRLQAPIPVRQWVTFEIFARHGAGALGRGGGWKVWWKEPIAGHVGRAADNPFRPKKGLTRFLPAGFRRDGAELTTGPVARGRERWRPLVGDSIAFLAGQGLIANLGRGVLDAVTDRMKKLSHIGCAVRSACGFCVSVDGGRERNGAKASEFGPDSAGFGAAATA